MPKGAFYHTQDRKEATMPSRDDIIAVILGGGRGTRLFPLTSERAKPAVPIAGKYRLIDIPISNCINSGIYRISVLTQFLSVSLHRHITRTYVFDFFTRVEYKFGLLSSLQLPLTGIKVQQTLCASKSRKSKARVPNMYSSWQATIFIAWIMARWHNITGTMALM